jgi:aryl-alcohol dehydrogenase-like predicted oxidoreductase
VRYSRIADTPLEVSSVGLGTNNFGRRLDRAATARVIDAALDADVNFFDTADGYGDGDSERFIGECLAGRRDRVVLATKFGLGASGARAHIREAIEASLGRLRTDHIDLYYYHRPDGVTPLAETIGALDELVREGKVRAFAASNFTPELTEEGERLAHELGTGRFVALQNDYSLLERAPEAEVLPLCERYEIGFVPYFPLASGLLSGKYRRGEPPPPGTRLAARPERLTDSAFDTVERLEGWARAHSRSLLELAIAYVASQAAVVSVIAGATTPEQVQANAAAADWRLSADELAEVAALA